MVLFWSIALGASLATVAGIAFPLMRRARRRDDDEEEKAASPMRIAALAALGVAPLIAAGIYMQVGAPESLSPQFHEAMKPENQDPAQAIAAMSEEDRAAMIGQMVEGLAARLEAEPDDVEGWRMLARSYGVLGRAQSSADAWGEVVSRDRKATAQDWRQYAAALIAAAPAPENSISETPLGALRRLHELNPDDPLALFFIGFAERSNGDKAAAMLYWRRLEEILPPDAPMMQQMADLIARLETPEE